MELATALANMVFPVPGGPVIRTPLGGSIPNFLNDSGFSKGNSMACLICMICSSTPPMSENVVCGFSMISAPETSGSHELSSTSIIERVS